MSEQRM